MKRKRKEREAGPRTWLTSKEPKHIYAWKAKLADAGGSLIRIAASIEKRELTEVGLKHKEL